MREKTWAERQDEGLRARAQWAAERGLSLAGGKWCIRRLWGACRAGFVNVGRERCPCNAPHDDHESLWSRHGRSVCWVSQPYSLDEQQRAEVEAFARRWGLTVTVAEWPSWHYPGSVLTVTYWRRGEAEFPGSPETP